MTTKMAGIQAALATVRLFKSFDQYMSMQAAEIFLQVAADEGLSIIDIEKRLNVNKATASRTVQYFSEFYKPGKPGLCLMRTVENVNDRRVKEVYLTPKGKTVAGVISAIASGTNTSEVNEVMEGIHT